jgi:hypothetical protein
MKKTRAEAEFGGLHAEYRFDYSKSRPNRFARTFDNNVVAVILDPDVAEVFQSSESVNRLLRSVIAAVPKRSPRAKKARRKAS